MTRAVRVENDRKSRGSPPLTFEAFRQAALSSRKQVMTYGLFAAAIVSLTYAVLTAARPGIDLQCYMSGALDWVTGTYRVGVGPMGEYPPFMLPLLSPIALVSADRLAALWIILNLVATAACVLMAIKLWGGAWPVKARLYLTAFLLTWAPFRVTLRNGQISLMILAMLLGALLARQKKRELLAGALLGLSLSKYSLTFPFFLYFVWKREWKIVSTALLIPLALTEVFALRLGLTVFEVTSKYVEVVSRIYLSGISADIGTSEIKLLILDLTGSETIAASVTLLLTVAALICMGMMFSRQRRWELAHFSALGLFALWSVYHRTYDSVMCLVPAALMVDMLVRKRLVAFGRFSLAALGLLIVSVPGVLIDRLKISPAEPSLLLMAGIHIERLLVFGMFWSLIFLIWKAGDITEEPQPELAYDAEQAAAAFTLTHESQHL